MFWFFKRKKENQSKVNDTKGRGILIFENTSEVIRAEKLLKQHGYEIKVVGPPPEIRKGCDLAIEFPLIYEMKIHNILREHRIPPLGSQPISNTGLKPVDLFQTKDFGKYLMVKAANMKLTIDKETLLIVNVSGGGCPDVPYISKELIGKRLQDAPEPRDLGHTLCGYALQLAYEKAKSIFDGKEGYQKSSWN
mgnify:CR=1 FL=1